MFKFVKNDISGNMPATRAFPTTASTTYKVGDAVVLSAGALVLATATTKPLGIVHKAYVAPASGMLDLEIDLIDQGAEWQTTFAADGSAIVAGNAVTLHTDGAQITATTTSGTFQILKKLGTGAIGTSAIGRFL